MKRMIDMPHKKLAVKLLAFLLCIGIMYASYDSYSFNVSAATNISLTYCDSYYSGVPQHLSAVSKTLPSTAANACFDYNANYKPKSNWPTIDYNNSSGKAGTRANRQLIRLHFQVTTGEACQLVTISTSLSDAYISSPSYRSTSTAPKDIYIEYYGHRQITVTATSAGKTSQQTINSSYSAVYANRFYTTMYNTTRRSLCSNWADFERRVRLNGSGYDDTVTPGKWYTLDWSSSASPRPVIPGTVTTASGTTPTENRTVAVDPSYITMKKYVSDGSTSSTWHRSNLGVSGPAATGFSFIAEDTGGAINGYHIDLYIGLKTPSEYAAVNPGLANYITNGVYFTFISTKGVNKG